MMLRNEIEVLKICQHPNICKLVDFFEDSKSMYVVLEHLKGGDMFEYLDKRDFQITEERVIDLVSDIAIAVAFMHSYSVVHRDIKLQNVMMSDDTDKAIPKLVDFGFARIIGPSDLLNEHYGSHGYTAPEILLKKSYRLEPDIWSLGVLLYSVYAGALPFASYDRKEMDKMVCEDPVEFSESGFEKSSKTALKLIKHMLHKDKKKRPVIEEVLESPFL